MLCYRDITFCSFYTTCKKGDTCFRALTLDVIKEASKWRLPIAQFKDKPSCFEKKPRHLSKGTEVL